MEMPSWLNSRPCHRLPEQAPPFRTRHLFWSYAACMLSLVVSTIAYFIAAFFIKRQLDEMDIPRSMTRSICIFVIAAALSYGVAAAVDWIFP